MLILKVKIYLKKIYLKLTALSDYFKHRSSEKILKNFNDSVFVDYLFKKTNSFIKIKNPEAKKISISEVLSKNIDKLNFTEDYDKNSAGNYITEERKNNILYSAGKILNHEFDLLGSGLKKVTTGLIKKRVFAGGAYENIDWHRDFKSGFKWNEKTWFKKIIFGNENGVDVKVPWELSRASHFAILGEAYKLSGNEKYTEEYILEIKDWIENNPYDMGVNWACTMDVAIRACNWIMGLCFFKSSKLIDGNFLLKISRNLYLHGIHVAGNLEKGVLRVRNNHYLSDLAGLFYIGQYFYFTDFGKKWKNFAIRELKKEINYQVYDDGFNFEASTYYHRLALELLFYPLLFGIKNSSDFNGRNYLEIGRKQFGEQYVNKIRKMFEVLVNISDHNGNIPQIGDNDNGRLHIFEESRTRAINYLIPVYLLFFRNESNIENKTEDKEGSAVGLKKEFLNSKMSSIDVQDAAIWLYGYKGLKNIADEKYKIRSYPGLFSFSQYFKDSGWFVYKQNEKDLYFSLMFICGQNGQNNKGGHAHNDKLSFVYNLNGFDIFTDPGTFVYTPDKVSRNLFRSTAYHNTVEVDKVEQNRFSDGNIFVMADESKAQSGQIIDNKDKIFFEGSHIGYSKLKDPVFHKRQCIFDKKSFTFFVRDIFDNQSSHTREISHSFDFNFNLHPSVDFEIMKNRKEVILHQKDLNMDFKLKIFCNTDVYASAIDSYYSESYGKKEKNSIINFKCFSFLPLETFFAISFLDLDYNMDYLKGFFKNFSQR